jgi:hypothetical protein
MFYALTFRKPGIPSAGVDLAVDRTLVGV